MRVSAMWGAKYLFLLETARGVITHSRDKQVRPFARWEPRKHFESLPEKDHGENIRGNSRPVDESAMMEFTELLMKQAISPFAPMPEQEDMSEMLYRSGREESAQEVRARRVLQTSCAEGESFAIASTLLPEVAGCYTATNTEVNDEVFYTETGDVGSGQNIVQAFQPNGDGSDVVWIVAFEASSDTTQENVVYCFSLDLAADVHPADVTSWFCFTNGPDEPDLVSTEEFSITCDCSSTSTTQIASSTSETSTVGPSPSPVSTTLAPSTASGGIVPSAIPTSASLTSTPTPANTCDGDFMVTSSAVPVLEGCFQATDDATSTANGEQIYTIVEGGPDEGTAVVTAAENDDFDPSLFWAMAIEGLNTSTADNTTYYCISKEGADEVHPADATWLCDLSGATSVVVDFVEVSDTDLAASCGCLGMTAAPSTISGNDQDADFGHRSTTLSASVTVGVSFAAAVVHLVGL